MYKMYKKYCTKIQNRILKHYPVSHYLIHPVYLLHELICDPFSLHEGPGIISLGGIYKKVPKDDTIKGYVFSPTIRSRVPFQGVSGQIFENFLLAISLLLLGIASIWIEEIKYMGIVLYRNSVQLYNASICSFFIFVTLTFLS